MTSGEDSVAATAGAELLGELGDPVGQGAAKRSRSDGRSNPTSASIANVSRRCPRSSAALRAAPPQRVGREAVLLGG